MKRKNEVGSIALLQAISLVPAVDSANVDLLEAFIECASADEKIKDLDPVLFATVLASRLTPKNIEFYDNNEEAEAALYVVLKKKLLEEIS